MRKKLLSASLISLLLLVLNCSLTYAQSTIRGTVLDAETSEPLTGATILLVGTNHFAIAGLDGSFLLRNISYGEYDIQISFISYKITEQNISVDTDDLTLDFRLERESQLLDMLEVTARRSLRTEESARTLERTSDAVKNVIDARSISQSPDVTVANVVQRISGVSLERSSSGDGQHAIVRGMDKRYNYTLVNGIKIPSPSTRDRYVPLDIFPSDLLDRLEVTKALTPDMEGDAIGGVIDMKMRDAPDRLSISANIGGGYSQIFTGRDFLRFNRDVVSVTSPRVENGADYRATLDDFPFENLDFREVNAPLNRTYGLAVGNRFFDNKMGLIVAGSYQQNYRGTNSLFYEMDVDREGNNPFFDTVQSREFSVDQNRTGFHSKIDYRINRNHKIDLYNAYIRLDDAISIARVDTNLRIGRSAGPGTGRITYRYRSQQQIQNIINTTLQGEHFFLNRRLNANWSAVYSRAKQDDPDMAEFQVLTGATRNQNGEIEQERALVDRDLVRRWSKNSDQDLAFYLNLVYQTQISTIPIELGTGGMTRFKDRRNDFNSYLLRLSPNTQPWEGDIMSHTWNVVTTTGTPTDPLNYTSDEQVTGVYGQVKAYVKNVQILTGLRVEQTDFSWITNAPPTVAGRIGSFQYADYLPSIHFRYSPRNDINVRLSYFESISRPNFFEVIPYQIIEENYQERGNPFLERTQAKNYDLRFEYYPTMLDQIMVAFFFKEIKNPIESALAIDGQRIYLQPNNFGTAENIGAEIDVTKYFRNIGLRAFYTFTNSEITTSKIFRFRDENNNLTSRQVSQTRPLQGQSRHISNISFLYKNQRSGTDAQISGVYTGQRIISVSPYFENDIWQRSFWQVDFSIEQQFFENYVLYLKVNNILNTPMRADVKRPNTANPHEAPYLDTTRNTLVREDFYQQTWMAGIKYSF